MLFVPFESHGAHEIIYQSRQQDLCYPRLLPNHHGSSDGLASVGIVPNN